MSATTPAFIHWFAIGFKEAGAMVWMTWWPLVLGFTLAGLVQSLLPRDALREKLGSSAARSRVRASLLGVISSSCSYAASSMSRALFARGASWTNSMIFMVASTNLVIELGIVLYVLLGWRFVLAQFIGGVVMVTLLAFTTRFAFNAARERSLRERVLLDSPPPAANESASWRERVRSRESYSLAARYTVGDFVMIRRELLVGFIVAGFLSVHVPAAWWSHLFVSGHGTWTVLENAALAPLVAVIAFVCSIGNIPLAAALWAHGVAFGGVIAFIFADLITLPLLAIYRRFYGSSAMWRLFALLWAVMSVSGLLLNGLFHGLGLIPHSHSLRLLDGEFPLGATLVLNVLATLAIATTWWIARRSRESRGATDPICGMTVDTAAPAATSEREGVTFYFCSLRCRDRFERSDDAAAADERLIDPICSMTVSPDGLQATGRDAVTYYFCSEGCRQAFLRDDTDSNHVRTDQGQ